VEPVLSSYDGRPVIVTGCSSGIGAAVTQVLIDAGAQVIGIDRTKPSLAVQEFLRTDMSSNDDINATVGRLPNELFAVFNCAGLSGGAADLRTVLRVNFLGLRQLTDSLIDRTSSGGAFVSTASLAGAAYLENAREVIGLVRTQGFEQGLQWIEKHEDYVRERGAYTVSKEAVILYTIDRCYSLAKRNIRINCIAPGVTDTPMLADSAKVRGQGLLTNPPEPLGRRASAVEQAAVMLFLNSSWASYVNGEVVWSDGGKANYLRLPRA
jgi:NAD(P)-dependent dehydrogenase (short-subunit alcohol dehydrogenase family)